MSSLEASQADTNMSVTKPSEQPRQDSTSSQSLQDASAAPAFKSKTDLEEDSLLEGIPFVFMWVCGLFFHFQRQQLLSCFPFQMRRICVLRWLGQRV